MQRNEICATHSQFLKNTNCQALDDPGETIQHICCSPVSKVRLNCDREELAGEMN